MPILASAFSLYAPPWTDLGRTGAAVATNEDAAYPIANAQNEDSADTFKSTTTGSVITLTVASSTPVAFALINTNATSIALTNNGGMASQAQTVPSRTVDGKQRNGWKDLTGVASALGTVFTFTVSKTGAAVLEIGRIVLVTSLLEFLWSPGIELGHTRYGSARNRTRLGSLRRRLSPVAAPRTAIGQFQDRADLQAILDLEAAGNGLGQGFLVIPDRAKNDALFVQPSEDALRFRDLASQMDLRLPIEEIAMGLPPALT